MFVITVQFRIKPGMLNAFLPLMEANARQSLADEPGCRQFDVCQNPEIPEEIFLYEVYDDAAAFSEHLATAHFKEFDAATTQMIETKTVQSYERCVP